MLSTCSLSQFDSLALIFDKYRDLTCEETGGVVPLLINSVIQEAPVSVNVVFDKERLLQRKVSLGNFELPMKLTSSHSLCINSAFHPAIMSMEQLTSTTPVSRDILKVSAEGTEIVLETSTISWAEDDVDSTSSTFPSTTIEFDEEASDNVFEFVIKLNGVTPLFPDPSPALDDVPEKLPKLKPSDDVCPFLPMLVAEAKFTPAKGFVGFDFWLSSLLLSSLLSFVALEVTLEGRTAFKVTGLEVIPLLSEADSGLVIV